MKKVIVLVLVLIMMFACVGCSETPTAEVNIGLKSGNASGTYDESVNSFLTDDDCYFTVTIDLMTTDESKDMYTVIINVENSSIWECEHDSGSMPKMTSTTYVEGYTSYFYDAYATSLDSTLETTFYCIGSQSGSAKVYAEVAEYNSKKDEYTIIDGFTGYTKTIKFTYD